MFPSIEVAQLHVREKGYRIIDLKFSDLWGRWHQVTIPASQFGERLMKEGLCFDGAAAGLDSIRAEDMVLIPDLSSGFRDPLREEPTLTFICFTHEADTRRRSSLDPRNIAHKAEAHLKEAGFADHSLWGPGFEFYILDDLAAGSEVNEAARQGGGPAAGPGHPLPPHDRHHPPLRQAQLHDLLAEICLELEGMGIQVRCHHQEVGGPGQCAIDTSLLPLLEAGDAIQMVKYAVKGAARRHGRKATFLPKPFSGEAGSGMRFHQMLYKGGKNLFYDPGGYGSLSQTALWCIGGLLKHAPALLAITNPSTHSFRRLVPDFEAPVNAFFSRGNRSAAIRVPRNADQPGKARFAFGPPDATCNPYLALAAQLMAGLDGIRNRIDPTAEGLGPIDAKLLTLDEDARARIRRLPTSLTEACIALEADMDFLLAGGVFDRGQLQDFLSHLRAQDADLRDRPHSYEMALNFDA